MKYHIEKINCAQCGNEQLATVEHTLPFMSYVHACKACNFINTESDWQLADGVCWKCHGRGEYEINFDGEMKTCSICNGG